MKKFYLYLAVLLFVSGCNINADDKIGLSEIALIKSEQNQIQINYSTKNNNYFLVIRTAFTNQTIPGFIADYNKNADTLDISISESVNVGNILLKYIPKNSNDNLLITGLSPATKYSLDLYSVNAELDTIGVSSTIIATLPPVPNTQATYIGFMESEAGTLRVSFNPGAGQGRIAVISEEENPAAPEAGKIYKANINYGDPESQIGSGRTFVVYDSKAKTDFSFIAQNIPNTRFQIKVYEYNTANDLNAYSVKDTVSNPRWVEAKLPPPVAIEPEFSTGNIFMARWNTVQGAQNYELQVATDKEFKNIYSFYNSIDTDTLSYWPVEIHQGTAGQLYYRVRAIAETKRSNYSNIIEVKF